MFSFTAYCLHQPVQSFGNELVAHSLLSSPARAHTLCIGVTWSWIVPAATEAQLDTRTRGPSPRTPAPAHSSQALSVLFIWRREPSRHRPACQNTPAAFWGRDAGKRKRTLRIGICAGMNLQSPDHITARSSNWHWHWHQRSRVEFDFFWIDFVYFTCRWRVCIRVSDFHRVWIVY